MASASRSGGTAIGAGLAGFLYREGALLHSPTEG
jgi:hypothetical protein